MTEREPRIARTDNIERIVTFWIADAPATMQPCQPNSPRLAFKPHKARVVSKRRGKKVMVTGNNRYGVRTATFNLVGYDEHDPAPTWLRKLWEEIQDEHGET